MKTTVGIALSLIVAGNLFANGTDYVDLTKIKVKQQNKTILGIQPMEEITGKTIDIWKISYGREVIDSNIKGSKVGLYIETGTVKFDNANSNRDIEFGLDFLIQNKNSTFWGISPYISGGVGIGWRNDKNDRKKTSTDINVITYVSTLDISAHKVPDVAILNKNTAWVNFSFGLGGSYDLTKTTTINLGYQYKERNYDLHYHLEGSSNVNNNIGSKVRYSGVALNISYKFLPLK